MTSSPAQALYEEIKAAGISVVASLPDSWLTDLLTLLDDDPDIAHVPVAREPEIVGICAGAWFGGRRAAGILGTAGLLTCGHEFATLNLAHQIPLFLIAAKRGGTDDPLTYQVGQGLVGDDYLKAMQIPTVVADRIADVALLQDAYTRCLLTKRPVVFYATRQLLVPQRGRA